MQKIRLTLFISLLLPQLANAGIILTFSTLQRSSITHTMTYLQQMQTILMQSKDDRFDELLVTKNREDKCVKKGMMSCLPGLYGFDKCVRSKKSAAKNCKSAINQKKLTPYFDKPEFNRMNWNAFLLGVSAKCSAKYTATCKSLLQLKGQFLNAQQPKVPGTF